MSTIGVVPLIVFLLVYFMSHIMLTHHVRNMFCFQLCCHSNASILEKRDSISTKTNIPKLRYFLIGQTSIYFIRDLVITRVKLFAFPPPNMLQCEEDRYHFPSLHHMYTWIKIHDWLSIIIISLHLKR